MPRACYTNSKISAVCVRYLQGLAELLPCGDVGDADGCAESVQHPHFLENIFAAGGADDEQLAALVEMMVNLLCTKCEASAALLRCFAANT